MTHIHKSQPWILPTHERDQKLLLEKHFAISLNKKKKITIAG